jgi:hypothetical protein
VSEHLKKEQRTWRIRKAIIEEILKTALAKGEERRG